MMRMMGNDLNDFPSGCRRKREKTTHPWVSRERVEDPGKRIVSLAEHNLFLFWHCVIVSEEVESAMDSEHG